MRDVDACFDAARVISLRMAFVLHDAICFTFHTLLPATLSPARQQQVPHASAFNWLSSSLHKQEGKVEQGASAPHVCRYTPRIVDKPRT